MAQPLPYMERAIMEEEKKIDVENLTVTVSDLAPYVTDANSRDTSNAVNSSTPPSKFDLLTQRVTSWLTSQGLEGHG